MDEQEITAALERIGLSDREQAAYLALVRQGPAPAAALAQRAKLARPNAYAALDGLVGKGLVYTARKTYFKMYYPNEPSALRRLVEEKKRVLSKIENDAELLVRLLSSIASKDNTFPSVVEFFGLEGLRKAYEIILDSVKENEHLIAVVPRDFDVSPLSRIGEWFIQERLKKNVLLWCLEPRESFDNVKLQDERTLRETRVASESITSSDCLMEVSESVIILAYWSREDLYTMVVRHRGLSSLVYRLLELVWTKLS